VQIPAHQLAAKRRQVAFRIASGFSHSLRMGPTLAAGEYTEVFGLSLFARLLPLSNSSRDRMGQGDQRGAWRD